MMTPGETIQKLVLAHRRGDEAAFYDLIEQYIQEERRKNHHVIARELERALDSTNGRQELESRRFTMLSDYKGDLPRDRERGVVLVEISEPARELEDLVLSERVRSPLEQSIIENRRGDLLRSFGLKPVSRLLFCGPPGTGKTVAAEALAKALYLPLALVRFDAVVSSYLGETASNLRQVFDFSRGRPMVLLFDEFDAIGKSRNNESEHGELKRVVNSYLQLLDSYRGDAIIIAATNHEGLLDPAIWRRFDEIVFFGLPNTNEIKELLTRNFRQFRVSERVDLHSAAHGLLGSAHADVERVALDVLKSCILSNKDSVTNEVLHEAIHHHMERLSAMGLTHAATKSRRGRPRHDTGT